MRCDAYDDWGAWTCVRERGHDGYHEDPSGAAWGSSPEGGHWRGGVWGCDLTNVRLGTWDVLTHPVRRFGRFGKVFHYRWTITERRSGDVIRTGIAETREAAHSQAMIQWTDLMATVSRRAPLAGR